MCCAASTLSKGGAVVLAPIGKFHSAGSGFAYCNGWGRRTAGLPGMGAAPEPESAAAAPNCEGGARMPTTRNLLGISEPMMCACGSVP